jgi:hypothetical protein
MEILSTTSAHLWLVDTDQRYAYTWGKETENRLIWLFSQDSRTSASKMKMAFKSPLEYIYHQRKESKADEGVIEQFPYPRLACPESVNTEIVVSVDSCITGIYPTN